MKCPPPTPEPASRPPVRLVVTVPAELADMLRARAALNGVSLTEVVRAALWRSFGMYEPARRK